MHKWKFVFYFRLIQDLILSNRNYTEIRAHTQTGFVLHTNKSRLSMDWYDRHLVDWLHFINLKKYFGTWVMSYSIICIYIKYSIKNKYDSRRNYILSKSKNSHRDCKIFSLDEGWKKWFYSNIFFPLYIKNSVKNKYNIIFGNN